MPKVVLYGPAKYGGKGLINVHTEKNIAHLEVFIAYMRGKDDIADLMRILLNTYQLVIGTHDNSLKLDSSRYTYGENNEIQFLWEACSTLWITIEIKRAWNP